MEEIRITSQEFALFQRLIYKIAGISLNDSKRELLVGRLTKRLRQHTLTSFASYYRLLATGEYAEELQIMVDLLTTNETYFFREPGHFAFLRDDGSTGDRTGFDQLNGRSTAVVIGGVGLEYALSSQAALTVELDGLGKAGKKAQPAYLGVGMRWAF